MNLRERFHAIMNYDDFDRLPVYFFGTWAETKKRWLKEGLQVDGNNSGSGGPQLSSMDTDWETSPDGQGCIWNNQGILSPQPISDRISEVIEETDDYQVIRTALGGVIKRSTSGESIPQHLEPDLSGTRKDWERFKKYLNPSDSDRWLNDWETRLKTINNRQHMTCFFGGSLFGWLRDWMGVEGISYLAYDDPGLYAEMITFMADYFIDLNSRLLKKATFDFAYFFEDCCFNSGPLLSPDLYQKFYHHHYQRMISVYRQHQVPWMLMDSDGKIDDLLPLWLDSGFDIIFPIEIGTWKQSPAKLRKKYGKRLRMMGGVDKHIIKQGEPVIHKTLSELNGIAQEGGFIPMPDHRIPPDVSLKQMEVYVTTFKDVFNRR